MRRQQWIEKDREHELVTNGALRLCARPQTRWYSVRTGATHSSLASWWGLFVRGLIVLLGIRAVLEERTLKQRA